MAACQSPHRNAGSRRFTPFENLGCYCLSPPPNRFSPCVFSRKSITRIKVALVFGVLALSIRVAWAQQNPAYNPLASYYASAAGLTGSALKLALHNLIDCHTVVPYTSTATDVWDALQVLDEDPANPANVLLVYNGVSIAKTDTNGNGNTGTSASWEREHYWPKSFGVLDTGPDTSDLFNLRACRRSVNSSRNNRIYELAEVIHPTDPAIAPPNCPVSGSRQFHEDVAAFRMKTPFNGRELWLEDLESELISKMAEPKKTETPHSARCGSGFATTRWSLVASVVGAGSHEADAALDQLCAIYWRPVYAEIRRRGSSPEDAKDLTQDFFARLLRHNTFVRAEPEKGRLRSYLLAALDHFIADQKRHRRAAKRGGGEVMLSIDADDGESWFLNHAGSAMTPAEAFDHGWAVILMDRALGALRQEYFDGERGEVFEAALPFLAAEDGSSGYDVACASASLTPEAFRVAVHRLRKRFRLRVRDQVEMTVAEIADVDAEMKHLFGI